MVTTPTGLLKLNFDGHGVEKLAAMAMMLSETTMVRFGELMHPMTKSRGLCFGFCIQDGNNKHHSGGRCLQSKKPDISPVGTLIAEAKHKASFFCSSIYSPVAHLLAKHGLGWG